MENNDGLWNKLANFWFDQIGGLPGVDSHLFLILIV